MQFTLAQCAADPTAESLVFCFAAAAAAAAAVDKAVKAFGIQVETQLSRVQARVLNPPLLAYGSPEAVTPGTRVSLSAAAAAAADDDDDDGESSSLVDVTVPNGWPSSSRRAIHNPEVARKGAAEHTL